MTTPRELWLDDLVSELDLVDQGAALLLVNNADNAQLPSLLRALENRGTMPVLCVSSQVLSSVTVGSVVVYEPQPEDMASFNMARPVIRERLLKILLWCDAERTRLLAERAPDTYDWISRYIECPRGVSQHAVLRLKRWTESGESFVELEGDRWRDVLDATGEQWVEVPAAKLENYATTVEFLRANRDKRVFAKGVGHSLYWWGAVRLVIAAMTEGFRLPVVFVGESWLRWYREFHTEPVALGELVELSAHNLFGLPASDAAALGVQLLHFEEGRKRWGGLTRPVPTGDDDVLESLWSQYDAVRERNRPLRMDPRYQLLQVVGLLGSGRRSEVVPIHQWDRWMQDDRVLQVVDVFAGWVSADLPFAKSNPMLTHLLAALAGEPSKPAPTPNELHLQLRALEGSADRERFAVAVATLWLARSVQSGHFRFAAESVKAFESLAQVAAAFPTWLKSLAAWLAGDLAWGCEWDVPIVLPPSLWLLSVRGALDVGVDLQSLAPNAFALYEMADAVLYFLPTIHQSRYDVFVMPSPTRESEDFTLSGLTHLPGEERGLMHALQLRLLYGEAAMERGAFDIAESQIQRGLSEMRQSLGEEHPVTLYAQAMLGRLYALLGAHSGAAKLLRDSFTKLKTILGDTHPETLRVRLELARVFDSSIEAVAAARRGITIALEARFGSRSPLTQFARRQAQGWDQDAT